MLGEVVQNGTLDPGKKNIGLYLGKITGSDFEKSISELAGMLAGRYNVFIIASGVKGTGFSAPGTILDTSRGMDAVGLKLTRSAMVINRIVKEYSLDAVVSLNGRTNTTNGLYNTSCLSLLYVRSIKGSSRFKRDIFVRACRGADILLVPSLRMREALAQETEIPPEDILVVGKIGSDTGADKLQEILRAAGV